VFFSQILTELQCVYHLQESLQVFFKLPYMLSLLPWQIILIKTQQVVLDLVHNGGKIMIRDRVGKKKEIPVLTSQNRDQMKMMMDIIIIIKKFRFSEYNLSL